MQNINSDINSLLKKINKDYLVIEESYRSSLAKKEIDSDFKIVIKNYLENARSALDYCARDISNLISLSKHKNISFPIVGKNDSALNFEGAIGRNLPDLTLKNVSLYNYLESIQPYNSSFEWLADFTTIVNRYKHVQLTPQTRTETQRVISKHISGGAVSWNPAAVHFGSGVYINGVPVNPSTQLPETSPDTTVAREVWVDFKFNDDISVLNLLNKIKNELPKIIEQVYSLM